jgi:hypothetical protein
MLIESLWDRQKTNPELRKYNVAIITTTINVPYFLESFIQNIDSCAIDYGKLVFIIIGDLKSPHDEIKRYIKKLNPSFVIEYWDIEHQKKWISKTFGKEGIEKIEFAIPYNSIRRRNLGYLRALELGSDVIVTIDDDNYPESSNWLLEHLNALYDNSTLPTVSSKNKIINPCRILKFNYPNLRIYSRGYPFSELFCDTFDVEFRSEGRVALNLGLWTKSPDVDAYTNILFPNLESLGIGDEFQKEYALAPNNYMPINTQNTAFIRELTPAFYDVLMDTPISGTRIDRYDDVWAGLFALKLIHKLNYRATFGIPLTVHRRNKHDYISDLKSELVGMSLNNVVHKIVMNVDIQSKNFIDGYLELAHILVNEIRKFITDEETLSYFSRLTEAMKIWIDLVEVFE